MNQSENEIRMQPLTTKQVSIEPILQPIWMNHHDWNQPTMSRSVNSNQPQSPDNENSLPPSYDQVIDRQLSASQNKILNDPRLFPKTLPPLPNRNKK